MKCKYCKKSQVYCFKVEREGKDELRLYRCPDCGAELRMQWWEHL